jgi:hypothetical protein
MCINRRINEKFKVNIKCRLLWSALILIILSIVLFPLFPHLVLSYEDDIVWFKPIMRDEKFTIKYTHSVNKSPVEDSIKWNGNKLIICESLYQSYGAGIPNEPENGQTFIWTEKGLLLSNINLERDSINLFVGTVADHYLIHRNQEYQLKKLAEEQTLLNISVKRLSLFNMFYHNFLIMNRKV